MVIYTLSICYPGREPIKIERIGEILFDNGLCKFRLITESGVLDSHYCVFPPVSDFYFLVNRSEDCYE